MKTLDDYMNDPSVINEPMPLREVHAIRLMIHNEMKDMSLPERRNHYKRFKKDMQEQYGFEFVASAN